MDEFATNLEALRRMAPAQNVAAVTPNDSADLPGGVCDALLVLTAGNLSFVAKGGGSSGTFAVEAGDIIPVQVARVKVVASPASVLALY